MVLSQYRESCPTDLHESHFFYIYFLSRQSIDWCPYHGFPFGNPGKYNKDIKDIASVVLTTNMPFSIPSHSHVLFKAEYLGLVSSNKYSMKQIPTNNKLLSFLHISSIFCHRFHL